MAYNKASEERKWRLWKEAEEKQLRELGVSEDRIAQLRELIYGPIYLAPSSSLWSTAYMLRTFLPKRRLCRSRNRWDCM